MNLETLISEKKKELGAKFPNLASIDGVGESGSLNGYDPRPYIEDLLTTAMQEAFEAGKEYAYGEANKTLKPLIK